MCTPYMSRSATFKCTFPLNIEYVPKCFPSFEINWAKKKFGLLSKVA